MQKDLQRNVLYDMMNLKFELIRKFKKPGITTEELTKIKEILAMITKVESLYISKEISNDIISNIAALEIVRQYTNTVEPEYRTKIK